jgi:hypothetical protein
VTKTLSSHKKVLWAIIAKQAEKTLPLYLKCLELQDYPKKSIVLYVRTNDNTDNTVKILDDFIAKHGNEYFDVITDYTPVDSKLAAYANHEWNSFRFGVMGSIRNRSMQVALEQGCELYFTSDVDNFIVPETLSRLVALDLDIVSPMLFNAKSQGEKMSGTGGGDLYSNFHCDYDDIGGYKHVSRYDELISRTHRGVHEVALVHCTYLVKAEVIPKINYLLNPVNYEYRNFSISAEQNGVRQHLDNRFEYGFLTLTDNAEFAASELESLKKRSILNQVAFKIVSYHDDPRADLNAKNLYSMFERYCNRFTSGTQILQSKTHLTEFTNHNKLVVLPKSGAEGWNLDALSRWASIYTFMKNFRQTKGNNLLLVEDHTWVSAKVLELLPQVLRELPAQWDYVQLYTPENERSSAIGKKIQGSDVFTEVYSSWSTAVMLYSQSGAQKILDYAHAGVSEDLNNFLFHPNSSNLSGLSVQPDLLTGAITIYNDFKSKFNVTENPDVRNEDL